MSDCSVKTKDVKDTNYENGTTQDGVIFFDILDKNGILYQAIYDDESVNVYQLVTLLNLIYDGKCSSMGFTQDNIRNVYRVVTDFAQQYAKAYKAEDQEAKKQAKYELMFDLRITGFLAAVKRHVFEFTKQYQLDAMIEMLNFPEYQYEIPGMTRDMLD